MTILRYVRIRIHDIHTDIICIHLKQQHIDDHQKAPRPLDQHFNLAEFAAYLEGIAGGNRSSDTSKAIVKDLKLFLQLTPGATDMDKLFDKRNLERFCHTLMTERGYKPTTIAEKIRRLKMAVKFIIHTQDATIVNQELYIRGSMLIEIMTQWCHSLSKAIALQRQQHSLRVIQKLPLINDPHEFLENDKVTKHLNVAMYNIN